MIFFEWKDAYELGLPDIDLQHTMIVNMLNELHAARKDGESDKVAERTLGKMLLYVEEHFNTEENAMRAQGFPGIEAHIVEHEVFRAKVHALHEKHYQQSAIVSDDLVTILMTWLKDHIAEVDQDFGRFVRERSEEARKKFFSECNPPQPGENR